jgi:hypothetical protein
VVRDGDTSGPRCTAATVAELRGLMTLIEDDQATDNFGEGQQAFTVMVEIERSGRVFAFAESFTAAALQDLDIGNWDERLFDETQIFNTGMRGAVFLWGGLGQIRNALLGTADTLDLIPNQSDFEPVVVDENRDAARKRFDTNPGEPTGCNGGCGQQESDQSALDMPLASLAQYRVTIHFAEKLNPGSGPCSPPPPP